MNCEHTARCTGHCCRSFFLSVSLDELKEDVLRFERGESPRFDPNDTPKLVNMLVLIREGTADEHPFVEHVDRGAPSSTKGFYYTCKHLDANTGDCTDYENRPDMCRRYPYGGRCTYKDCTSEDARNPPVKAERLTRLMKLSASDKRPA